MVQYILKKTKIVINFYTFFFDRHKPNNTIQQFFSPIYPSKLLIIWNQAKIINPSNPLQPFAPEVQNTLSHDKKNAFHQR